MGRAISALVRLKAVRCSLSFDERRHVSYSNELKFSSIRFSTVGGRLSSSCLGASHTGIAGDKDVSWD